MNEKNINKQISPIFDRKHQSILSLDCNQNSIIALLKGPDIQYEKILMNENDQVNIPIINDRYQDKNSFLQIHVRKFIEYCVFKTRMRNLDYHLSLILSYRSIKC